MRNGPRALVTGVARLLFGVRPARPWISYDAQAVLSRHIAPETRVLEFGSGMSTEWFARRAAHVVSVEDDETWFAAISSRLGALGNVDYKFATDHEAYLSLPEQPFDLILIDGPWRTTCSLFAMRNLAPGGIVYLDNADKFTEARRLLMDFAAKTRRRVREFTDFAPAQLFVQRGLMIGP